MTVNIVIMVITISKSFNNLSYSYPFCQFNHLDNFEYNHSVLTGISPISAIFLVSVPFAIFLITAFLDALPSPEILYIKLTHSLTYFLTNLGKGSKKKKISGKFP